MGNKDIDIKLPRIYWSKLTGIPVPIKSNGNPWKKIIQTKSKWRNINGKL